MKNFLLFILAALFFNNTIAQADYKKPSIVGLAFFLKEFKPSNEIKSGLGIGYIMGLNNHLDFSASLSASFLDYTIRNTLPLLEKNLLLEFATTITLKLNTDKHWLTPFITGGAGFSSYKNYNGLFIPAGLGLQLNHKEQVYILLSANYNSALSENVTSHLEYRVGILGNITRKKMKKQKTISIPAKEIKEEKGIEIKDRDGDGIIDSEDACPDIPGFIKYKGCPIPDTDKDGINDEEDKCPAIPGVARYSGCPVPDGDGDGLNDEEDKCPDKPGPISNFGCPVIDHAVIEKINTAAKNIFFETGSAVLLSKSYPSLDSVVKVLFGHPTYSINIEGHTDIIGSRQKNQILSDQRAASVKIYFIKKGISESRITSAGFGQDKPMANNNTAEGRAKNRRVEMKLSAY